jgi:hypothetical protein
MPAVIEGACDFSQQCRGINRFDEVEVNTGLVCASSIYIPTPARQRSDENIAPPRTRTNAPARLETINTWHIQVHEHDLGPE